MTRARPHRNLDRITIVAAALALVVIACAMGLSVLDGNLDVLLWQIVAALGHVVALSALFRIRLHTTEEP